MKLFGKKVHKGTFLLLLSFMAISACCITILGTIKTGRENELLSRKYYSDKARKFQIQNCDNADFWENFLQNTKLSDFALYTTIWDEAMDIRAFYGTGNIKKPPVLQGRFFDKEDQFSGKSLAVVGKSIVQQLQKENNQYILEYRGVSYKVIGIVGTKQESRMNNTVYIDFASGIRINTVNTRYVIDGKKSRALNRVLQAQEKAMAGEGQINLSVSDEEVGIDRLFSGQRITQLLYSLILLSFFLSGIIVTALWMSYKNNEISIKRMLGFQSIEIISDICREYLWVAGSGFLCSLPVVCLILYRNQVISISPGDILVSFFMTVLFGMITLSIPLYQELKVVISEKMR